MDFLEALGAWPRARIEETIERTRPAEVEAALGRERRTPADLCALLSPHAQQYLEPMAQEVSRLTRWHFGRTIGMYVPIYISNVCGADCVYCGYAVRSGSKERRLNLTPEEIREECAALAAEGFQSVLLLTGEARRAAPVSYIAEAVSISREYFPSVCVEVYSLDEDEYRLLCDRGLEGVTLYMETYDRSVYKAVHLKGEKTDYEYRLHAIERAGNAGVRRLSIGALLGLTDWRIDGFWTALHGQYLQKACWRSSVSVSVPRLLHTPDRYRIPNLVGDRELVQLMLAMRLFLPEAGFNLSTRERAAFRDRLIPLGVTMMSAGSSTRPGGYATHAGETLEQFSIEDTRSPADVAQAIRASGYEPVWKDYDYAFDDVSGGAAKR
jgi:2-iminoacetate synthase